MDNELVCLHCIEETGNCMGHNLKKVSGEPLCLPVGHRAHELPDFVSFTLRKMGQAKMNPEKKLYDYHQHLHLLRKHKKTNIKKLDWYR